MHIKYLLKSHHDVEYCMYINDMHSFSWSIIRSQVLDVEQDTEKETVIENSINWNCSGYDDWSDGYTCIVIKSYIY